MNYYYYYYYFYCYLVNPSRPFGNSPSLPLSCKLRDLKRRILKYREIWVTFRNFPVLNKVQNLHVQSWNPRRGLIL